jgi:hypothetical protein
MERARCACHALRRKPIERANGPAHASPGQRPGFDRRKNRALKGRLNDVAPLQGFDRFIPGDPGRCPGLAWFAPLVLEGSAPSKCTNALHARFTTRPRPRSRSCSRSRPRKYDAENQIEDEDENEPTPVANDGVAAAEGQRPCTCQPRATPWVDRRKYQALKGRPDDVAPLQGFDLLAAHHPGRCPGLAWFAPLVLEGGAPSKSMTRPTCSMKGHCKNPHRPFMPVEGHCENLHCPSARAEAPYENLYCPSARARAQGKP